MSSMRLSIRQKIVYMIILMALIGSVLFTLFSFKLTSIFLENVRQKEVKLASQAIGPVLGAAVEMDLEDNIREALKLLTRDDSHIAGVEVLTAQRRYVQGNVRPSDALHRAGFTLKGSQGQALGEVIIYYTAAEWDALRDQYIWLSVFFIGLMLLVGIGVMAVVGRILRPLDVLASSIRSYVPGRTWSNAPQANEEEEIRMIAAAFAETAQLANQSYETLQQNNLLLENKVRERTRQLIELNDELADLAQRETALRLDNEKFHNVVFDKISLALALRDAQFRIVRVNDAYLQLFGYPYLTLRKITGIVPDDGRGIDDWFATDNAGAMSVGREFEVADHQGRQVSCFGITTRIVNNGQVHYVTALSDLTRLRRIEHEKNEQEQMLMQQSKLAAMGEMIGNIAHQWRQPLAQMSSLLIHIEGAYEFGKLTENLLRTKIRQGEQLIAYMSRTIDDFRNFFLPNKHKFAFRVVDAVNDAMTIIDAALSHHHIDREVRVVADTTVRGFPNEYAQVILNLLSNAKDVLIERKCADPRVTVTIDTQGDFSRVTVDDNGGGIDPAIMPKICDPYFTTKHKSQGTGIGLYMTKMIIEKNMDGCFTIENYGDGVRATILIAADRGPIEDKGEQ